ncbi:MAG: hypothetical protein OEW15_07475 [Nitrospirota bacterium]|nr:hypothetical protein [Nitrospirota bacterium]
MVIHRLTAVAIVLMAIFSTPVLATHDEPIKVKASTNQEGYLHLFSVDQYGASASSIPMTCAMPSR